MNAGYTGGNDVVQFWFWQNYEETYACLSPNEYFADDLSDDYFDESGQKVDDNIRSHRWVTAGSCATWLT
ncbi:hypothetical protein [Streptomyces sp. LUP30]|uniref:hypothetical protein n=1 Tax=Streptomyces sp. LUP30 TaxID=1890285 RepID=UPI0008516E0A|nr:hypothetical protein [Streptomyces sp. LUP30]